MDAAWITRSTYIIVGAAFVLAAWMNLDPLILVVFFASLLLSLLGQVMRRWQAVVVFVVLTIGVSIAFLHFVREAYHALPRVADTAIPMIIDYAKKWNIELPFSDLESLKALASSTIRDELKQLGKLASVATKEFVLLVAGLVIAISAFLHPHFERNGTPAGPPTNLYAALCTELKRRIVGLFHSFRTVMGAQLIISAVNTAFTAVFLLAVGLPHPTVLIAVTFLCGMLPIIGNLISNTMIVSFAFTISPQMAVAALTFLVVIHKLEYFLNSKIIGSRINNPVWLTLLALILGERLMGIPGMVLAPVLLHFIKTEASKIQIEAGKASQRGEATSEALRTEV